jgi:hypothetical protein
MAFLHPRASSSKFGVAKINGTSSAAGTAQQYHTHLEALAAATAADGGFVVGDGSTFTVESGATARTSMGLGSIATQAAGSVSITGGSIAGIIDLAIADGGTGASNASGARTNLGLVIGTDVQAYDADLAAIAALSNSDGNIIVGDGSAWVAESGATARASLGLTIGTNVQAYDAQLDTLAALSAAKVACLVDLATLEAPTADGQFIVATGAGAFAYESAGTARASLGLGTAAITNTASLPASTYAGALAMGDNKITGLATPTADADASTKAYVDSVAQGLDVKDSVKAATTANITLSGTQTIDGVSVLADDRVLVKNQSTGTENGIYVCAGGSWSRASDFAAGEDEAGAFTFVEQGTVNAESGFVCTNNKGSGVVGTHALVFSQFSGAGQITAGNGLAKSGNTLSVNVDDSSIEINSDALRVKASGITNAMLGGSIANAKLSNSTVAFGGVSLALGASDATPAFDLADATNYPTSSLVGTITNAQLAGSIANGKLANSSVTIGSSAVALGGTVTAFSGLTGLDFTAANATIGASIGANRLTLGGSDAEVRVTGELRSDNKLRIKGRLETDITSITGATTIADTDTTYMYLCNPSGGSFTVTLPTAADNARRQFVFKHSNSGTANTVTIDGESGETIDGEATQTLNTSSSITVVCDGSGWHII